MSSRGVAGLLGCTFFALAVLLATPRAADADFFRYVDDRGTLHVVDDAELVPARYRSQLADAEERRIQVQPSLNVPAARPRASTPEPASTRRPMHRSFSVARLSFDDEGQPEPGEWMPSIEVAPRETVHVVVAATWCPHCIRFFAQLAADPGLREAVDMVAFFEDEGSKQGRLLTYPQRVAELPLPFYLVQRSDLDSVVSGYPTLLRCNRQGCKKTHRGKFIERHATR